MKTLIIQEWWVLTERLITKAEAILQALMVAKTRGVDVNKIYKLPQFGISS